MNIQQLSSPIMISPQELASRYINQTNKNVFLTGKAGTGKTTFLKSILERTHKKAVIVAPTGIAAINAGGVTIHSMFQLPFGSFIPANVNGNVGVSNGRIIDQFTLIKSIQMNDRKRKLLRELELLIIDEVSMLRVDLVDAIDTILRHVRYNRNQPFGGVQVLFIGDMLQLPPVINEAEWQILKRYYPSQFFFDANVLLKDKPIYVTLEKIYRQSDEEFITLLNNFRNNKVTKDDLQLLNSKYIADPAINAKNCITLTTHNRKAETINEELLLKIRKPEVSFSAKIEGEFNENIYPVERLLRLKVGAQIMFIKNDPTGAQRFFNGKIGEVIELTNNSIQVEFEDCARVQVEMYEWKNIKYEIDPATNEVNEVVQGTFTQYPIKLAWAITVHKSQGLTFDKAIIDISEAFAPGQIYVALSRLRSLSGLRLLSPIRPNGLLMNERVSEFSTGNRPVDQLILELDADELDFVTNFMQTTFNLSELSLAIKDHVSSYSKAELKSEKQKHVEWAKQFGRDLESFLSDGKSRFNHDFPMIKTKADLLKAQQVMFPRIEFLQAGLKDLSLKLYDQLEKILQVKRVKNYAQELAELEILLYEKQKALQKLLRMFEMMSQGKEFEKNEFDFSKQLSYRNNKLKEITSGEGNATKQAFAQAIDKGKLKKPKRIKGETKLISLELFNLGKPVQEIAKERNLTISTVFGHLEHFVNSGELDLLKLVNKERLVTIQELHLANKSKTIGELQEILGKEYNYAEIRMAVNQLKLKN